MHQDIIDELKTRLQALAPESLQVDDESHRHRGHAGSNGGAHLKLTIVAGVFSGQATLIRHRLVYDALGDLMHTRIHALAIDARTPD